MRISDVFIRVGRPALLAGFASLGTAAMAQEHAPLLPPADVPEAPLASSLAVEAPGFGQELMIPGTAADAALSMANMMDGAAGGISSGEHIAALESAAEAGRPMALYNLGLMYENGEGVEKDEVKAFGYFRRIVDESESVLPRSIEADIVAQSLVKTGQYYLAGLPEAGITANSEEYKRLVYKAATEYADAEAQYQYGRLLLDKELGDENPILGARWLKLAAVKGHISAQAVLGDLLFNGEGLDMHPVEGLMWLTIARDQAIGAPELSWVGERLEAAMSIATPEERTAALKAVEIYGPQLRGKY